MDPKILSRAGIAGFVMAVAGVGMFFLLWIGLGSAGVDTFMRLILSICVPPALMAFVIGVYMLVTRKKTDA